MSNFQIVLIGIFIIFIVGGVLAFATFGGFTGTTGPDMRIVTVWGTVPQSQMDDVIKNMKINAQYAQKSPVTFQAEFVDAIAEGTGPDIILLPQDLILQEKNKILPIPYTSYPERRFDDTFIQEAELYKTADGILGLPFIIDPMVMYWNRDNFSNSSISQPPKKWGDFYDLATKLSVKTESSVVRKSAVSFGEYTNVLHAKDIVTMLILQTGNKMVLRNDQGNHYSVLDDRAGQQIAPVESVLTFYTGFADPLRQWYSWSPALPLSRDFFLSGDLSVYFGFASEYADLHRRNPNLNFDVAPVPQAQDVNTSITFGNMQALAILKSTKYPQASINAISSFTKKETIERLSNVMNLPPVRRDLLAGHATSSAMSTFFTAALQSRAWLDPDALRTENLFKNMIESVTSGRSQITESVASMHRQLNEILRTGGATPNVLQ